MTIYSVYKNDVNHAPGCLYRESDTPGGALCEDGGG